jgi:hypothetical protein
VTVGEGRSEDVLSEWALDAESSSRLTRFRRPAVPSRRSLMNWLKVLQSPVVRQLAMTVLLVLADALRQDKQKR